MWPRRTAGTRRSSPSSGRTRPVTGPFEGTDTYQVTVSEIVGEERDRIFEEQGRQYPGFAKYAEKTAGIRTIPVLALRRA